MTSDNTAFTSIESFTISSLIALLCNKHPTLSLENILQPWLASLVENVRNAKVEPHSDSSTPLLPQPSTDSLNDLAESLQSTQKSSLIKELDPLPASPPPRSDTSPQNLLRILGYCC